jgi:hypothetical protein
VCLFRAQINQVCGGKHHSRSFSTTASFVTTHTRSHGYTNTHRARPNPTQQCRKGASSSPSYPRQKLAVVHQRIRNKKSVPEINTKGRQMEPPVLVLTMQQRRTRGHAAAAANRLIHALIPSHPGPKGVWLSFLSCHVFPGSKETQRNYGHQPSRSSSIES